MAPPRQPRVSASSPAGRAARVLMRGCNRVALATLLPDEDGGARPFASLAAVAFDHDGSPLLLLSRLAEHTRNLAADARLSLLFDGTEGLANPQEGARATVIGRAGRSDDPRHRARYLARHPAARLHADFADFAFYRVAIEAVHHVGGFARAVRLDGAPLVEAAVARRMAEAEPELLRRLAEDEAGLAARCARACGGGAGDWCFTGIDADGADLARGEAAFLRVSFEAPVTDADEAVAALRMLAARTA